jgi:hypothetical protein
VTKCKGENGLHGKDSESMRVIDISKGRDKEILTIDDRSIRRIHLRVMVRIIYNTRKGCTLMVKDSERT